MMLGPTNACLGARGSNMHCFDAFHCDTRYTMPQVYKQQGQAKHTHVDQNMFIHSALLQCRAEVDGC